LFADNTKAYWSARKAAYEEHVKAPMTALLEALEPEFGPAKMFRPYRDVRFSKDKSPYKTHQGGHVGGFYLQIDADGLMVAGGMYAPSPQQLQRFRAAVDADGTGKALAAIVDQLRADDYEIAGDRLKTRPRGFAHDHPRIDLLRHRSLYAHRGWPPDLWVQTPEVIDRVRVAWRGLRPLIEWGNEHIGRAEGND
jgi:uncharacterized protein (TIGR02453 family)